MLRFIKSRILSFKNAIRGFWHVIKSQQNAWLHFVATFLAVTFGIVYKISPQNWIALLLVIGIVWIAEFLNTALETIVDLASPEQHPLAKIGKDVGAAAVLIAASISIVIGILIFGSHFLDSIKQLF